MNGFSLLELVVVLAILAISSALVAPRIVQKAQKHGITEVATTLRAHQRKAVTTARNISVELGVTVVTFSPTGVATPDTAILHVDGRAHRVIIDTWSGDVAIR
ncbi:MAG TPA: prepilin-type N-terminal cleavage/methylation domain-containing protein [Longimicrobiales bacterium]